MISSCEFVYSMNLSTPWFFSVNLSTPLFKHSKLVAITISCGSKFHILTICWCEEIYPFTGLESRTLQVNWMTLGSSTTGEKTIFLPVHALHVMCNFISIMSPLTHLFSRLNVLTDVFSRLNVLTDHHRAPALAPWSFWFRKGQPKQSGG